MTSEECPVDVGQTDGTWLDMVNGSVLDISLDVYDIAAAITCMGNGCFLPFDAADDEGVPIW